MHKRIKLIMILIIAVLTLTGCMQTVDEMYRIPKRSIPFSQLQSVLDDAMSDLDYSAPIAGDNRQTVQMADLNGDDVDEYLIFTNKEDSDQPLRVLIIRQEDDTFKLAQIIECCGMVFDTVEYVNMDTKPGLELVFGTLLTEQLPRSVNVYTFTDALDSKLLLSANYSKFLSGDLDGNEGSELLVIKPALMEGEPGTVELYGLNDDNIVRMEACELSGSAENLKHIQISKIEGGIPAAYMETVAGEGVTTDVYTFQNGLLVNLALSNDSVTDVGTLRNYHIYADDIDSDGIIELPSLMPMMPMENKETGSRQELIRWYSLGASGEEYIKAYTFHNFADGWYMDLSDEWAAKLTVADLGDSYEFYIWDEEYVNADKVFTIFVQSEQNNVSSDLNADHNTFLSGDVLIAAKLEESATQHGITPEWIKNNFHGIHQAWETGET